MSSIVMPESDASPSVQLTPAQMLVCKPSPRKLIYSLLYTNALAAFLHIFGFGPGFLYSLVFCNCTAIACFISLYSSYRIFKPVGVMPLIVRIIIVLAIGPIAGTIAGALIMGMNPVLFFGEQSGLLFRMILFSLVWAPILMFVFSLREQVSEAKQIILEERIKNLDIRNMTIETELKLLQAQIEPHFLFNTLSNVISLIETNPERAKAMLEHFSGFLRGSLHGARDKTITIAQEMELIRNYLNIHSVRMGSRLNYTVDIPDVLLDYRIPPLLIQPLVENSVKHGLDPEIEGGEIIIGGTIEGNVVKIVIADSGKGITESSRNGGIGLDNVRRRMRMFYNENARLLLEENKPSGVRAIIEVPYGTG